MTDKAAAQAAIDAARANLDAAENALNAATTPAPAPAAPAPAPTQAPAPVPAPAPSTTPSPAPAPTASGNVTASFSPTTAEVLNPERGWYIDPAMKSPWFYTRDWTLANVQAQYAKGFRLMLGCAYIGDYMAIKTLPDSVLSDLDQKLGFLRASGVKGIIRAVYNYDDQGKDAASVDIMLNHAVQLAAVYKKNADVLPFIQAGFKGPYGENWKGPASTAALFADTATRNLRDALLNGTDPSQYVMWRYPSDIMMMYPTALTAASAFSGSPQARTGMHNDCMQSDGIRDSGTWLQAAHRPYIAQTSEFTPYGGETCPGGAANFSAAYAIAESVAHHLQFQNSQYDPQHINQWKADGQYDLITRMMGYRVQLNTLSHPAQVSRGGSAVLNVGAVNQGWGRVLTARRWTAILKNKATGAEIVATGDFLRNLPCQAAQPTTVAITVPVPAGAAAGQYAVFLAAPDPFASLAADARYAVHFANADNAGSGQAYSGSTGRFATGTTIAVV